MTATRVLVVDDEADFTALFAKRFSKRGLEVAVASGGAEGLAHLAAHEADVVVLDVMMPGMDGIETLKELKKRHPDVEVIMLTGHGSVDSGLKGLSLGAFDYVMKPFQIEDMMERIAKASDRARINRRRRAGG
ncbi:MAG: response regulator [Thermodesulfobacteriota bacterium]